MRVFSMPLVFAAILIAAPVHAQAAAGDVELSSQTNVVRVVDNADGTKGSKLEPVGKVVPGDVIRFSHNYRNTGTAAATDFVLDNPVPAAIAYRGSGDGNVEVSVDGGKTFGKLAGLTVPGDDGKPRPATGTDVTHVRWVFLQPIPAGAGGTVEFDGEVK